MAISDSSGTTPVTTSSVLLIGDIGLLTLEAAGTDMAGSVRVQLGGAIGILQMPQTDDAISFIVERDGADTFGSGTIVSSGTVRPSANGVNPTLTMIAVSACDFPPAAIVNNGLIRYTLFITSMAPPEEPTITLIGPVSFNGSAVADLETF